MHDPAQLEKAYEKPTHELVDLPDEVTIEMAIRLAKKYGGEESGRFVNGVLAQVLRLKNVNVEV